jgi:hypothetical protein
MAVTLIPKERLGPLALVDADISEISFAVIGDSGAEVGEVMAWNGSVWVPTSLDVGTQFTYAEVPTGVINGTNKEFTLADAPSPELSLMVFLGGVLLREGVGNDYVLDDDLITFSVAPKPNDVILAFYRH